MTAAVFIPFNLMRFYSEGGGGGAVLYMTGVSLYGAAQLRDGIKASY